MEREKIRKQSTKANHFVFPKLQNLADECLEQTNHELHHRGSVKPKQPLHVQPRICASFQERLRQITNSKEISKKSQGERGDPEKFKLKQYQEKMSNKFRKSALMSETQREKAERKISPTRKQNLPPTGGRQRQQLNQSKQGKATKESENRFPTEISQNH